MLDWQLKAQKAERGVLQHVLHSLCFHQWAEALAIIFDSWTPKSEKTAAAIAAAATYPTIDPKLELRDIATYSYEESEYLKEYVDVSRQCNILFVCS